MRLWFFFFNCKKQTQPLHCYIKYTVHQLIQNYVTRSLYRCNKQTNKGPINLPRNNVAICWLFDQSLFPGSAKAPINWIFQWQHHRLLNLRLRGRDRSTYHWRVHRNRGPLTEFNLVTLNLLSDNIIILCLFLEEMTNSAKCDNYELWYFPFHVFLLLLSLPFPLLSSSPVMNSIMWHDVLFFDKMQVC